MTDIPSGFSEMPDWLAAALEAVDKDYRALLERAYETAFNAGEANEAGSGQSVGLAAMTSFGAILGVFAAAKAMEVFPDLSAPECTNRVATDIRDTTNVTMQQILTQFLMAPERGTLQ